MQQSSKRLLAVFAYLTTVQGLCGPAPNITGATLSETQSTPGYNATYSCVTGLVLTSGKETIVCQANNTWDDSGPVCSSQGLFGDLKTTAGIVGLTCILLAPLCLLFSIGCIAFFFYRVNQPHLIPMPCAVTQATTGAPAKSTDVESGQSGMRSPTDDTTAYNRKDEPQSVTANKTDVNTSNESHINYKETIPKRTSAASARKIHIEELPPIVKH